ncbi:EF-hand [Peniophora sp. CONT]|nr:EF-hand [Peniophora sp. CONT]
MSYGYGGDSYGGGGYGSRAPPPPGGHGAPGGFAMGGGPPGGPPPGADPMLWNWFTAVDVDRSGMISASELQRALINGDWSPFDLDTVKLLMNIFDTDRSGTIGFNEFSGLWKYIKDWQGVFRHFDRDNSGSIDGGELSEALRQFGYNLSPQLLVLLERKYGGRMPSFPGQGGGPQAGITFDRFVRACVVIKQITESFQRLDTDRDGWVQINYDQFMQTVLELP